MEEKPTKLNACTLSKMEKPAGGGSKTWIPQADGVREICEKIKSGEWEKIVKELREAKDPSRRKAIKTFKIPRANFAGTFSQGNRDADVQSFSGFFVIDIDGKDNPGADLDEIKATIGALPWTLCAFSSPSGNGVKAVVFAGTNIENIFTLAREREAMKRVLTEIFPKLKIDESPAALLHAFVSSDRDAILKPRGAELWTPSRGLEFKRDDAPTLVPRFNDLKTAFSPMIKRVWASSAKNTYLAFNDHDHESYDERGESQIWRMFAICGFPKIFKDELLTFIDKTRRLDDVRDKITGYPKGVFRAGTRVVAVKTEPQIDFGEKGKWETIAGLLHSRFDDPDDERQFPALLFWLHRARRRIKETLAATRANAIFTPPAVPMLIIVGEQGLGKSEIFRNIILPLCGGRLVEGKKVLFEDSRFNNTLGEGEVVCIDDVPAKRVARENRQTYAEQIKSLLYSGTVSVERKNKDAEILERPCHVAVQLCNPESANTLPDYSVAADKMLCVECAEYYSFRVSTEEEWKPINAAIAKELPAFAYYLDNEFALPDSLKPRADNPAEMRNGMQHFFAKSVRIEFENVDRALSMLDDYDARAERFNESDKYYNKRLTASDIAEKAGLRVSPETAGLMLRSLTMKEATAARVQPVKDASGRTRGWIIREP